MIEINVKDFELDHIFDCGQSFRWNKEEDGSYTGIAFGHVANMSLNENVLRIETCVNDKAANNSEITNIQDSNYKEEYVKDMWQEYLDLNTDYGEIKDVLAKKDSVMGSAISSGEGIRIL